MRVFQIEQTIDAIWQGYRTIQEYAIELESLWADYDRFTLVTVCNDPQCKSREVSAHRRTIQFLKHLNLRSIKEGQFFQARLKFPHLVRHMRHHRTSRGVNTDPSQVLYLHMLQDGFIMASYMDVHLSQELHSVIGQFKTCQSWIDPR